MQKLKDFIKKYYEGLAYLFFGGVATLLNLVVFAVFQAAFGTDFATGLGNVLDNILCILFAYWTNRTFVFKSTNKGKAASSSPAASPPWSWISSSSGWASACWGRQSALRQPIPSCGPWA